MIKWNQKGLDNVEGNLIKALNKTGIDTLTNINSLAVVPFDIGTLEKSGNVLEIKDIDKAVLIGWDTPYALRLYVHPEYNFQNGRKGRWADDWIRGSRTIWVLKTFKHNASKELK